VVEIAANFFHEPAAARVEGGATSGSPREGGATTSEGGATTLIHRRQPQVGAFLRRFRSGFQNGGLCGL
jgi:hypothetical protein